MNEVHGNEKPPEASEEMIPIRCSVCGVLSALIPPQSLPCRITLTCRNGHKTCVKQGDLVRKAV